MHPPAPLQVDELQVGLGAHQALVHGLQGGQEGPLCGAALVHRRTGLVQGSCGRTVAHNTRRGRGQQAWLADDGIMQ